MTLGNNNCYINPSDISFISQIGNIEGCKTMWRFKIILKSGVEIEVNDDVHRENHEISSIHSDDVRTTHDRLMTILNK